MEALEQRNQNFGCRPEDERLFVDYKATGRFVSTVRHKITSDRRVEARLHKRHAFHKKDTLIMCHRLWLTVTVIQCTESTQRSICGSNWIKRWNDSTEIEFSNPKKKFGRRIFFKWRRTVWYFGLRIFQQIRQLHQLHYLESKKILSERVKNYLVRSSSWGPQCTEDSSVNPVEVHRTNVPWNCSAINKRRILTGCRSGWFPICFSHESRPVDGCLWLSGLTITIVIRLSSWSQEDKRLPLFELSKLPFELQLQHLKMLCSHNAITGRLNAVESTESIPNDSRWFQMISNDSQDDSRWLSG